jgi:hypothetical protein
MNTYNARQLNLMKGKLDAFDDNALSLRDLVVGLEGLLNALQDVDDVWRSSYLQRWGVLEEVYADALDKKLAEIPNEHIALINSAIKEIRELVAQKL